MHFGWIPWFLGLAVILLAMSTVFGEDAFASVDPFEVYSSLVARLSAFGRRSDGVPVLPNPLENLDDLVAPAGRVGVVSVLFGSTAFDSFQDLIHWLRFSQRPLTRGWTLTGFASDLDAFAIYRHPTAVGAIKVSVVVPGHVLAVGYTIAGLALLFSS